MQLKPLILLVLLAFSFAKRSGSAPARQSYLSPNNQRYTHTTRKLADYGRAGGPDGDEEVPPNDEEDPPADEEVPPDDGETEPVDPPAGDTGETTPPPVDNSLPAAPEANPEVETDPSLNQDAERQKHDSGEGGDASSFGLKSFAPVYSEVVPTEVGAKKMSSEGHIFKNGYDPVYNQMLNGPMNLYLAQMQAKMLQNNISLEPMVSDLPTAPPELDEEKKTEEENSGPPEGSDVDQKDEENLDLPANATAPDADQIGGGDLYTNIADYSGGSDGMQAEVNTPNYHDAPFRFVNDATTKDINELKKSLDSLTTELVTDALNAKPLHATNPEDEKAIIEISGKTEADPKIAKKLQEQQQAALKTGDPFEISILHKINTKIRKIQDAVTRHEIGPQQELPAQTIVLKNLVSSVKSLRKQAEKQYQEQPMRTQAKDERYLHKMEKLLKKMTELMNDRTLTPKQFNHLSELYRDKLNRLRLKCK